MTRAHASSEVPAVQLLEAVRFRTLASQIRNAPCPIEVERRRSDAASCLEHLADLFAHHLYVAPARIDPEGYVPTSPFGRTDLSWLGSPAALCAESGGGTRGAGEAGAR